MDTITIVGKNSKLYNLLDFRELKKKYNVVELSYLDVVNSVIIKNPIVFSISKNIHENKMFLEIISNKRIGKIVYISSIAAEVYEKHNLYNYPEIKYSSERVINALKKSFIIRVGIVEGFHDVQKSFYGNVKLTNSSLILDSILGILTDSVNERVINCWKLSFVRGYQVYFFIHYFQKIFYYFSPSVFFLFRPIMILYRLIGYKNYGYTFIANNIK
jgi:hypothetical protein